ncbi:MAG: 2-dehydropantoate 2-reductase N-terminal domain-containing protein, partial [Chloroflexota bacterium]
MRLTAPTTSHVVVGSGSWGSTLAILLARRQDGVVLLCRDQDEADRLRHDGENARFLPGIPFPPGLAIAAGEAHLASASTLTLAVPSEQVGLAVRRLEGRLPGSAVVVCGSKGLTAEGPLRLSQVIRRGLPNPLCVLSGPNLAREIARQQPASTVVASDQQAVADLVQRLFASPSLRVYTS